MDGPHVIHFNAVYDREAARKALGLTKTTLARELRLGRLQSSKRAGRYYILGKWLLQWLENGEVSRSHGHEKPRNNACAEDEFSNKPADQFDPISRGS